MLDIYASTLQHLFTKELGISITAYSMELRLQQARTLLVSTFKSIKEVRNEAGIPDGPNFVRHFKSRYLMSPSDYRKTFRNRSDEQIPVLTNKETLQ